MVKFPFISENTDISIRGKFQSASGGIRDEGRVKLRAKALIISFDDKSVILRIMFDDWNTELRSFKRHPLFEDKDVYVGSIFNLEIREGGNWVSMKIIK